VKAEERYATTWHSLFPRFIFASLVIAFVGELLQWIVSVLIPFTVQNSSSLPFRFQVQEVVSIAYFPFAAFALFYLSSRVRINLGSDYVAVAVSIFLGVLVVSLLFEVPEALASVGGQGGVGNSALDALLQSTANAVWGSVSYAFVGFVAVLLSYRRRM